MKTQKEIAKALDYAAARSESPASSKQCWYLAGLIAAEGRDETGIFGAVSNPRLSAKTASFYIQEALDFQKRQAARRTA